MNNVQSQPEIKVEDVNGESTSRSVKVEDQLRSEGEETGRFAV